MVIRRFDEESETVRSDFFRLIELGERADAATLFAGIEFSFREDGVSFDNLIGFASDGANAMLSRHNSVKSRLLEKQPNLFVIHCICHVAALCAFHACISTSSFSQKSLCSMSFIKSLSSSTRSLF